MSLMEIADPLQSYLSSLGMPLLVSGLVGLCLLYSLRIIFRRMDREIPLIALNIAQLPLVIIFVLVSLKLSLAHISVLGGSEWLDRGLTAAIVIVATYLIAQITSQVILHILRQYAQQTEAMWDDVLLPFLQVVLPLLIYIVGIVAALQSLNIDLTGFWVAIGGVALALSWGLQSIVANIAGGIALLMDAPFGFGDVVTLSDGTTAVVRNIGLRMTRLFIVETHCEILVPNALLESQSIVNLSRPSPYFYYALTIPLRADTEPKRAIELMQDVVLAHPDTLGNIDEKLRVIDQYFTSADKWAMLNDYQQLKKTLARDRLLAEKAVNQQLLVIRNAIRDLADEISILEKNGLDYDELRDILTHYLDIVKLMGFTTISERQGKRRSLRLAIAEKDHESLIGLVRNWYRTWAKDPDLTEEDQRTLQDEWEQKIKFLNLRANRLLQKIDRSSRDERNLDGHTDDLLKWLNDAFKHANPSTHDPKIWTTQVQEDNTLATLEYIVKFYVDNIKLEQCQRGNRVKSEVQREVTWQLRQAYIYR
jgi:MscS family membrane protein